MQIDCIKINWSTPGTGSFVCSSANKHNQVISNEQLKTTKHSKGMSEFLLSFSRFISEWKPYKDLFLSLSRPIPSYRIPRPAPHKYNRLFERNVPETSLFLPPSLDPSLFSILCKLKTKTKNCRCKVLFHINFSFTFIKVPTTFFHGSWTRSQRSIASVMARPPASVAVCQKKGEVEEDSEAEMDTLVKAIPELEIWRFQLCL